MIKTSIDRLILPIAQDFICVLASGAKWHCFYSMRFWLEIVLIPFLALLGSGMSALTNERPSRELINTDDWARTPSQVSDMGDVLWVDSRSASAFAEGGIDGALNVSLNDWDVGFESLILKWAGGDILVFCDGKRCALSRETAERLRAELGVENVYWLQGGLEAWKGSKP